MKRNELSFPYQLNGRAVTVWVEVDGNGPRDIYVSGATDDETDKEVELPEEVRQMFYDKVYESMFGE